MPITGSLSHGHGCPAISLSHGCGAGGTVRISAAAAAKVSAAPAGAQSPPPRRGPELAAAAAAAAGLTGTQARRHWQACGFTDAGTRRSVPQRATPDSSTSCHKLLRPIIRAHSGSGCHGVTSQGGRRPPPGLDRWPPPRRGRRRRDEKAKMRLAMPRSFTDHPLSRKAQPPLPQFVILNHCIASDFVAMLDFAGNICDLACVRAGWGIM